VQAYARTVFVHPQVHDSFLVSVIEFKPREPIAHTSTRSHVSIGIEEAQPRVLLRFARWNRHAQLGSAHSMLVRNDERLGVDRLRRFGPVGVRVFNRFYAGSEKHEMRRGGGSSST
jgi:hypothetical protein